LFGTGLIHRDVKPENFRFRTPDPASDLVLVDFGLCCPAVPDEKRSVVGTLLYVAPEVFSGRYSTKVDLWSVGVVLYILLTGKPPWKQNLCEGFVLDKTIESGEAIETALKDKELVAAPVEARMLLKALLSPQEARPDAAEALCSQWLSEQVPSKPALLVFGSSTAFCSASKYSLRTPKKAGRLVDDFSLSFGSNADAAPAEESSKEHTNLGSRSATSSDRGRWAIIFSTVGSFLRRIC